MNAYKGTREFYPKEKSILNYIFNKWRSIALKYGFSEIECPIIEPLELFTKKSGKEIESQLYSFEDKAGRKIALRPEITPSIARMIVSNKSLQKPIKWFSIPECFRYEKEQAGRSRSFYQLNMDIIGSTNLLADAEIIAASIKILESFGLNKDFFVRISNRKLMKELLYSIGIKEDVFKIIDKKSKVSNEDFKKELKKLKLTDKQIKDLDSLLKISKIEDLKEYNVDTSEMRKLFVYLKEFNVLEYCKLDLTIVRGLDYYTGTVFEVFDKEMKYRAIAGGGRYDNLVDVMGGEKCPGMGFGMGDVILSLLLKEKKLTPELNKEIDYFVAVVEESSVEYAIKVAEKLREKYNVEMEINLRKLSKQLNYANSIKAKKVVIIGSREEENKEATIKEMKTGKETKIKFRDL